MATSMEVLWSRFSWWSNIYLPQLISDAHYTDRLTGAVSCSRKHNSICWAKNLGPLSYQINAQTINQHAHTHTYIQYWHTADKHTYIIDIHKNLLWSPMYELKFIRQINDHYCSTIVHLKRDVVSTHRTHTCTTLLWNYTIFIVCNCKTNHSHDQPQHSIGIKQKVTCTLAAKHLA